MAAANTETDFPTVLAAYIDARREVLGLPAVGVLPCLTLATDGDATYPNLFIAATTIDSPHRRRMNQVVMVELQTEMEKTEVTDEDTWLAALHRLLNDVDAFKQWLASQTPSFGLRKLRITGVGTVIDTDKKLRGRRTELNVHLRPHEFAPMPAFV